MVKKVLRSAEKFSEPFPLSLRYPSTPLQDFRPLFCGSDEIQQNSRQISRKIPDPPILAFFDFLAFFVFRFSLLFLGFFLPFPRILGVPRKRQTLAFLGKNPCFLQKSKVWRVRDSPPKNQQKNSQTSFCRGSWRNCCGELASTIA